MDLIWVALGAGSLLGGGAFSCVWLAAYRDCLRFPDSNRSYLAGLRRLHPWAAFTLTSSIACLVVAGISGAVGAAPTVPLAGILPFALAFGLPNAVFSAQEARRAQQSAPGENGGGQ